MKNAIAGFGFTSLIRTLSEIGLSYRRDLKAGLLSEE
jgi:hypothetical protein